MGTEHTVRSYDEELSQLTNTILRMGGLVESQIAGAVAAVRNPDSAAATRIVEDDRQVDDLERDVEQQVTKMLALRQPMAVDLRVILGSLKMVSDLERMGDLAANIAKRSIALTESREEIALWVIPRMADSVLSMVKQVLDAYVERDLEKAASVWHADAEIDAMYNGLFRQLLTYMFEDPRKITACTHLMFVAKNLERIADHATNMAEVIHFLMTGKHIEGDRPKGDNTSTFGGPPDDADDDNDND